MQFTKATRKKARLRLALTGASGSGKTEGALKIATGLGGKIAVIDTEHESASLYSDRFEFDSLSLQPPYTPERFISAIQIAEKAGYNVLIIDSLSHEWNGSGGCIEINDTLASAKYKGNSWSAWNETTPRHRKLLDEILNSPLHIIATMRSKTETVQGEGKRIMKLGMKAEQREGSEYEFTTVLDIDHATHIATSSKDRTQLFNESEEITIETGKKLLDWLDKGEFIDNTPKQMNPEFLAKCIADIAKAVDESATRELLAMAKVECLGIKDNDAWKKIQAAVKDRIASFAN